MSLHLIKRRQKQAAFKRRKKENQEHRVEIYLSTKAYQKMLTLIKEEGITRSQYFNHLILSPSTTSLEEKVVISSSIPFHQENEDVERARLLAERGRLEKELEKQIYWSERLEQLNKVLEARVDVLEKQRSPDVPVQDVL